MFLIQRHFLVIRSVVCTLFGAVIRRFFRLFDGSVHTERTRDGDFHAIEIRLLACQSGARGNTSTRPFCACSSARNCLSVEPINLARVALVRLGLVGKGMSEIDGLRKTSSIESLTPSMQITGSRFRSVALFALRSRPQLASVSCRRGAATVAQEKVDCETRREHQLDGTQIFDDPDRRRDACFPIPRSKSRQRAS